MVITVFVKLEICHCQLEVLMSKHWQVVSTYTNQDALDDGIFVDISNTAKDFGFLLPFYSTDTVFRLGEERIKGLLIKANMKIHSGQIEDGNLVVLEEPEGIVWVMIEGTDRSNAVMKIMFREDY